MTLPANDVYRFENIELSASQCRLSMDGSERHLRWQAFQVLLYLIQQQDRVVGRDELIRSVWHGAAVSDDSLGQCISEIREALGDSPTQPRYIRTLRKIGYQFIGPAVSSVGNGHAEPAASPELNTVYPFQTPADLVPEVPSSVSAAPAPKRHSVVLLLTLVSVAALSLAASLWIRQHHPSSLPKPQATASEIPTRRSIAVLGFKNLSGRPEDAWLSTALSDWLSTEMAAGEQLRTVMPDAVAEKKAEVPDLRGDLLSEPNLDRIGRRLGTDLVLSGEYAKLSPGSDGIVRLDLRLQDTHTGETLAAFSESGSESHLLQLVSNAGQTLRAKIAVPEVTSYQASEVAATLPTDPAAAKLYAEGVEKLRASDFPQARDLLEKAVALVPDQPMPHAALAAAWEQLGYDGKAEAEARRAFDLSSHLSRADHLLIEARFQEASRDWDSAIRTYSALFSFFPDDLDYGLSLVNAQVVGGKWHDALQTIAALRRLPTPLKDDPRIDWQEARAARSLGDMNRAVFCAAEAAQKARVLGASSFEARALMEEAKSLEPLQNPGRVTALAQTAEQLFATTQDQQGLASATNYLADVQESQGNDQAARKGYEAALAIDERIENQPGIAATYDNLGGIELELGDPARALQRYREAATTYRRIGEQDGVALAEQGLGDVYLATGQLKLARANDQDSLDICRENGNRGRAVNALIGLSQIDWAEGNLSDALDGVKQAKASLEHLGDHSGSLHLDAELSSILLDQGRTSEAVNVARTAAAASSPYESASDRAEIHLALANALLAQNNVEEARDAFEVVRRASGNIQNRALLWSIEITAAQLAANSGKQGSIDAEKQVRSIARDASSASFVNVAFDARLQLGRFELDSANSAQARADLNALRLESSEKGFQLIAKKAASGQ